MVQAPQYSGTIFVQSVQTWIALHAVILLVRGPEVVQPMK